MITDKRVSINRITILTDAVQLVACEKGEDWRTYNLKLTGVHEMDRGEDDVAIYRSIVKRFEGYEIVFPGELFPRWEAARQAKLGELRQFVPGPVPALPSGGCVVFAGGRS